MIPDADPVVSPSLSPVRSSKNKFTGEVGEKVCVYDQSGVAPSKSCIAIVSEGMLTVMLVVAVSLPELPVAVRITV